MVTHQIVLVDDDRSWSQAAAELLRAEGYDVHTAEDGQGALELLEEINPQVIVLDTHLPKLGGLELLQELRQGGMKVPILMVSADDRSALIAQAMGAGASRFLRKPVAAGLFLRAIRQLIARVANGGRTVVHTY